MNEDIIGENHPNQTQSEPNQIPEPIQVDLTKLNTEINITTFTTYLKLLQNQNLNTSLYLNLIKLLAEHHQTQLAYALTQIALEKQETHPILSNYQQTWNYLDDLPNLEEIKTKIKNQWLTKHIYKTDFTPEQTKLLYPQAERSDLNKLQVSLSEELPTPTHLSNTTHHSQIIENITKNSKQLDSFPDTVLIVPPKENYYLYRVFHLEPFQTYQVKCKCVTHLPVNLSVETLTNNTRLNYKLSRSVIQYRFHSLNLNQLRIGLKGENPHPDKNGQLRLIELTVIKVPTLLYHGPKYIRNLTPKFPVIGTLNFPPKFKFTSNFQSNLSQWLQTILPQLDCLNIYLPNPTTKTLPDEFQHPKLQVITKLFNYPGTFHFIQDQPGYHFHFSPYHEYHQDYIPILLTKIQQYNYQAVVGLHAIQLSEYPKKKIIPSHNQINQDIKCHLITLPTLAFFGQTLIPILPEIKKYDNTWSHNLQLGIECQKYQIPLISIERLTTLSQPTLPPHPSDVFTFTEDEDTEIKSRSWKYF